jgi:ArsR family transcriptional regulator, arsenate/arsenite/antimonite-responsive transcriptional repressor
MAFSKSHLFDPADQITSASAKVLCHPARLNILRFLATTDSCTVETLSTYCPLSKSTISEHLEKLRKSGVVIYREEFPHTYYSLDHASFNLLFQHLLEFILRIRKE